MDTWTLISKIRTAKAEFLGSFRALDILLPQNSALAVLILEIDVHVSIYLLLNERTLLQKCLLLVFIKRKKMPVDERNMNAVFFEMVRGRRAGCGWEQSCIFLVCGGGRRLELHM